jgi:hypothetical protein
MAYFAYIDEQNQVVDITIHADDQSSLEQPGLTGPRWIQTSYNATIRKNYAGLGYTYDPERDAFIAPQPSPTWQLNEATCQWQQPPSGE